MARKIVKGSELMLFDESGKSYAFATNHTLTLTAETSDTSSKDHGLWSDAEVTKFSWEISTENLFEDANFQEFFTKWQSGTKFSVQFAVKQENNSNFTVADGDYSNWNLSQASASYKGTVVITSLTANANNGENANYSCSMKGCGKFAQVNKVCPVTVTGTSTKTYKVNIADASGVAKAVAFTRPSTAVDIKDSLGYVVAYHYTIDKDLVTVKGATPSADVNIYSTKSPSEIATGDYVAMDYNVLAV